MGLFILPIQICGVAARIGCARLCGLRDGAVRESAFYRGWRAGDYNYYYYNYYDTTALVGVNPRGRVCVQEGLLGRPGCVCMVSPNLTYTPYA